MVRPPSIAVAQTVPQLGNTAANVAEHVRLAEKAAAAGAGLVVFPELSLTGYELELAGSLAFALDDDRLAPMVAAAEAMGIQLVVGAPVRADGELFIGAMILGADAAVDVYAKQHLGTFSESAAVDGTVPPGEPTVFVPGDRDPEIRLGGLSGAIAICADVGQPAHAEAAARRGADLYLASMFVIPSELAREQDTLAERARTHGMLVAFANFGGRSGGLRSGGTSAIWDPNGECLAALGQHGPGLVVARLEDEGWRADVVANA